MSRVHYSVVKASEVAGYDSLNHRRNPLADISLTDIPLLLMAAVFHEGESF